MGSVLMYDEVRGRSYAVLAVAATQLLHRVSTKPYAELQALLTVQCASNATHSCIAGSYCWRMPCGCDFADGLFLKAILCTEHVFVLSLSLFEVQSVVAVQCAIEAMQS